MNFSCRKACIRLLIALGVSACQPRIAPVEQVYKMQKVNKLQPTATKKSDKVSVEHRQSISQYLCQDDILIKINKAPAKKTAGKSSSSKAIMLTFKGTEHRLSPIVTKTGKKFSNIRWTWQDLPDGRAELSENGGGILATDCRLQP